MTDRKLYGTKALIQEFVLTLEKVKTIDGGWSTLYLDNRNGYYWLKYTLDDRGFENHLMLVSPAPTTEELIDIAFSSIYTDEVVAAASRLILEERTEKKEFRQLLMNRMSQFDLGHLDISEKGRLKTIIQSSHLTSHLNRRDIMGKHYLEIERDAAIYSSIASRALKILSLVDNGNDSTEG